MGEANGLELFRDVEFDENFHTAKLCADEL